MSELSRQSQSAGTDLLIHLLPWKAVGSLVRELPEQRPWNGLESNQHLRIFSPPRADQLRYHSIIGHDVRLLLTLPETITGILNISQINHTYRDAFHKYWSLHRTLGLPLMHSWPSYHK